MKENNSPMDSNTKQTNKSRNNITPCKTDSDLYSLSFILLKELILPSIESK